MKSSVPFLLVCLTALSGCSFAAVENEGEGSDPEPIASTEEALLLVNQDQFYFNYYIGQGAPQPQTLVYTTLSGSHPIGLSAGTYSGGPWLSVSGSSYAPGSGTVSVNPFGLGPGNYWGLINVYQTDDPNSTRQLSVSLSVTQ